MSGWILRRCDGSSFPEIGSLRERKTHMLKGSSDGWVIPGGFERVARATTVWRVEGVPDALALFSHLPADHAVITNICGAKACPRSLDFLGGKAMFVMGDADISGREGAAVFAAEVQDVVATVKIVALPYTVENKQGKDVRDFLAEGHSFTELLALAESHVAQENDGDDQDSSAIIIRAAGELIRDFPQLRPPLIEGLLRHGETMNIIAPPKAGKSWMSMGLGLSVVSGRKWLGQFLTTSGKVLIVDNELHPETSAHRLPRIAEAMGIQRDEYADRLFVANLRGQLLDLKQLALQLLNQEAGEFSLIVLDAWYRFQPSGSDENSNSDVSALYNLLDSVADKTGSAFVCIHHTSKGNQSGKGVTDIGAGAGAQARAPDAHLAMRLHGEDNAIVVEAAVRSFAPMEPFCLRWQFPIWTPADDLDSKDLRQERPRREKGPAAESGKSSVDLGKQRETELRQKVLAAYQTFPNGETITSLRDAAGMSGRVFGPINSTLIRERSVEACNIKKNNCDYPGFRLTKSRRSDNPDNSDKTASCPTCPTEGGVHGRTSVPPLGDAVRPTCVPPSDLNAIHQSRIKTLSDLSMSSEFGQEESFPLAGVIGTDVLTTHSREAACLGVNGSDQRKPWPDSSLGTSRTHSVKAGDQCHALC